MRDNPSAVVIVALSGRALAAAASRAGDHVVVLDLFTDIDTRSYATAYRKLRREGPGFDLPDLLSGLRDFGNMRGLVYGAGFEHDPKQLEAIAARLPLLGNSPDTVAATKDPIGFAALLSRLRVPHPAVTLTLPAGHGWVQKRIGGAGGAHITSAADTASRPYHYYQRHVSGRALSALFLGTGREARIIGYSEQWADGNATAPYRYGGSAGPVTPAPALAQAIEEICTALTRSLALVGLNSLDLLVDGDRFHVLEINPRPGATLDIFDGIGGLSLWRAHLDAIAGRLPERRALNVNPRAALVVYAGKRMVIPEAWSWPVWSADRGAPGTVIDRGEPVCTIIADGPTAAAARDTAQSRATHMLDLMVSAQDAVA